MRRSHRTLACFIFAIVPLSAGAQGIIRTAPLCNGNVMYTGRSVIRLAQLTSPDHGRNILRTTHEDRITATIEPMPGSTSVEIRLVTSANVNYWKALEIVMGRRATRGCFQNEDGYRFAIMETQDDRREASLTLSAEDAARSTIVFWKGKGFNVHTPMYDLLGNLGSLAGQRLTIYWEVD